MNIITKDIKDVLDKVKLSSNGYNFMWLRWNRPSKDWGFHSLRDTSDAITALKNLLNTCENDPSLLEYLSVDRDLMDQLVTLVKIYHSNGALDNICLRLLIQLAKTNHGSEFILSYFNEDIQKCHQFHYSRKYYALVLQLEKTLEETEQLKELKHKSEQDKVEDLNSIEMDTSSCGILLGQIGVSCSRTLLRRRVRALPHLFNVLPIQGFIINIYNN
jgi:hypothetical protein